MARTKTPRLSERVLDAAARLFGVRRFHEVRMDDIAAEAEVSKGTLYRYFEDKEELYLALLARASRDLVARMHGAVEGTEGAQARLVAIVATLVDYFDAQPHLFDLIQRAEVLRGVGEAFPWQPARDEGLRLVRAVFREGAARGEFCMRDPEQAALMLLGGLRAVVRFGPRPRPRRLAEQIADDFLGGVDVSS